MLTDQFRKRKNHQISLVPNAIACFPPSRLFLFGPEPLHAVLCRQKVGAHQPMAVSCEERNVNVGRLRGLMSSGSSSSGPAWSLDPHGKVGVCRADLLQGRPNQCTQGESAPLCFSRLSEEG